MAKKDALWADVRADFLATGMSYPKLAAKYGVSISTLKKKAAREAWSLVKGDVDVAVAEQLEPLEGTGSILEEAEEEPEGTGSELEPAEEEPADEIATVVDVRMSRYRKFMDVTDAMMDRIQDALESPDVITPYALKLLASALRDLREMQGLNRSALDIEEQQARIAKLRSETRVIDVESGGGVLILPSIDEAPVPPESDDE